VVLGDTELNPWDHAMHQEVVLGTQLLDLFLKLNLARRTIFLQFLGLQNAIHPPLSSCPHALLLLWKICDPAWKERKKRKKENSATLVSTFHLP
jgi:hypothetical protein